MNQNLPDLLLFPHWDFVLNRRNGLNFQNLNEIQRLLFQNFALPAEMNYIWCITFNFKRVHNNFIAQLNLLPPYVNRNIWLWEIVASHKV